MNYLPPMDVMCPTCPFRSRKQGGKTEFRELLADRALTERTPICHSTGTSDVGGRKKLFKEDRACRGARNLQIAVFHTIGFLEEPTDACWLAKLKEIENGK